MSHVVTTRRREPSDDLNDLRRSTGLRLNGLSPLILSRGIAIFSRRIV
jgi:hypothetical protein